MWARLSRSGDGRSFCRFQSTRRVGRDEAHGGGDQSQSHFNPRARVGRDQATPAHAPRSPNFNPRARVGRDHRPPAAAARLVTFQSTRPVWGATQFERHRWRWTGISIHTPRVGRDAGAETMLDPATISIHTPRVGRDHPRPRANRHL